jgi:stage II sporulation protein M
MFADTLHYIHTHLVRYIIVLSLLFIASAGVGVWYAHEFTVDAATFFELLAEEFEQIGEIGVVTTFLVIFLNNVIKSFLVIVLGVFIGVLPIVFIFTNGFIVGVIGYFFYSSGQLTDFMFGILPHGIIEIPAAIIASAMGLHVGVKALRWVFGVRGAVLKVHVKRAINVFVHVILPAFLLAALIETFVTPFLLGV